MAEVNGLMKLVCGAAVPEASSALGLMTIDRETSEGGWQRINLEGSVSQAAARATGFMIIEVDAGTSFMKLNTNT